MTFKPTGFSESLQNRMAEVKTAAQRIALRATVTSLKNQERLAQQSNNLEFLQYKEIQSLEEISGRLAALTNLGCFLDDVHDSGTYSLCPQRRVLFCSNTVYLSRRNKMDVQVGAEAYPSNRAARAHCR